MPTSAWLAGLSRVTMPVLRGRRLYIEAPRVNDHVISTSSYSANGVDMSGFISPNFASATYPGANRALAFPFEIAGPFLVRKVFWFNGTTVGTDSADVAVYDEAGTRIISGGGTLTSGANGTQEVDVADTFLRPGRYWCAYAQNGVTATPIMTATTAANLRAMGCCQMASAYVLPATLVPAAVASTNFPLFGIASRTLAS